MSLQQVFTGFAGGAEMDGKTFAKLAKDCKILDKKLTATDIDLIFAKVKERTARKINFTQFQAAIGECASKKGVDAAAVQEAIMATGGPQFAGTQADAVRFHDDKSQYTGVHAAGGPTTVDSVHPVASFGGPPEEEKKAPLPGAAKAKQGAVATSAPAASLQEAFNSFATGGEMDGKTFAKVSKDTKILDKKLTATDIDLIFAKVKERTARKINFAQFEKALELCAEKKGVPVDAVNEKVMAAGGPVFSGTKAEAVKYHDDKSQYTGVHAQGGPSTVDGGVHDLSQLANRSAADVRGVQK